jgi:D-alanyl-lipoteichoic acid acyltransferase DltB (MBOAT superfamily)
MLFSTWQFILGFLPITLAVFFLIPARWRAARKVWLSLASLFFYGYWKVEYVPLLIFSIVFNFTIAELLNRWRGRPAARRTITVGVGVNLLLLGYYKYTNFIVSSLGIVVQKDLGRFDIVLPLAISFFTFTQIGYLVDVYRDGRLHYNFLDYALFVVFFPHLIAGPIVRHWEVIPQYAARDLRVNRADLGVGLALFLMGLFKKVLLADQAAVYADVIYGATEAGTTLDTFNAWFGTLAYALQIYFDFSGYSDMAIGLARMFSIRFPGNFDSPYRAGNIIEFWRRWHMTLTRFLREYVYFTLGGNRRGPWRQAGNVLGTFFLSGLWHGAGWTFVTWGVLHGVYLVSAHQWQRLVKNRGWRLRHWSYRGACVLLTFIAVLFSWVFFRAPNFKVANRVLASMVGANGVTMSAKVTNPERQPGRFFQAVGVQFVADTANVPGYTQAFRIIFGLLALAWFCPNSQQLLRQYDPIFEENIRPAWWRMRLHFGWGLAMGALLFFVARSQFTAAPSPFLYFNF